MKIIWLFVLVLLTSCAVYDSERGVLVTSKPKVIRLEPIDGISGIRLGGMIFPGIGEQTSLTNTAGAGGVYSSATYSYKFDQIDFENLKLTLMDSFTASGISISTGGGSIESKQVPHVNVDFKSIDMIPDSMNTVSCLIVFSITVSGNDEKVTQHEVKGHSGWSVSGSKNQAIEKVVTLVWEVIGASS